MRLYKSNETSFSISIAIVIGESIKPLAML